ncbi:hypothetical protein A9Q91_01530 [Candidatus Gracilibacteria bacterium 28_42_T64]|nr:hypothetical protein A9Q91_01530 [Candidatus Gracilibacteria bacterium 28_42_T64]
MFKASIRVYKNINGKEEEIKKDFDNEKEYNDFVEKNPELKKMSEWKELGWPKDLFDMKHFFEERDKILDMSMFDEIEDDFKKLSNKARGMLGK